MTAIHDTIVKEAAAAKREYDVLDAIFTEASQDAAGLFDAEAPTTTIATNIDRPMDTHRIRPLVRPPVPLLQQEQIAADAAFEAGKKRIYVTTGAGTVKRIALDFDGKDTIRIVKAKIQEKEGIPIEQQLLSLELGDEQKLENVFGGYEIDMVLGEQYELIPALQLLILESFFRFILK